VARFNQLLFAILLLLVPNLLSAQDLAQYEALSLAAAQAHVVLDAASATERSGVLDSTLQMDLAVIAWLDAFLAAPSFGDLSAEEQTLARRDRYRHEYNASRLLNEMGHCDEARARIRALLDQGVEDDELRPRLTETYEAAIVCEVSVQPPTAAAEAPPATDLCVVGNQIEVVWQGTWYDSTVVSGVSGNCMIHYDGWSSSWDEAVGPERMRPRQ